MSLIAWLGYQLAANNDQRSERLRLYDGIGPVVQVIYIYLV